MKRIYIAVIFALLVGQAATAQMMGGGSTPAPSSKPINGVLPWRNGVAWMIYIPNIDQPEGALQHFVAALRARDRAAVLDRLEPSSKPLIDACLTKDKGINHLLTMTHNLQMGLDYSVKVLVHTAEEAWVAMIPGTEPNPIFSFEGLPDAVKMDGYLFRFLKIDNDWYLDYIASQTKLNDILQVNTAPKQDKALAELILAPKLATKPAAKPITPSQKITKPVVSPAAKPVGKNPKAPRKLVDWRLSNAVYKQNAEDFTGMVASAQAIAGAMIRKNMGSLNALYLNGSSPKTAITAQQLEPIIQQFGVKFLKSDKPESCVKLPSWVPMWVLLVSSHGTTASRNVSMEGIAIYQPDPSQSGLLLPMVKKGGVWLLSALPQFTSKALKYSNYTLGMKDQTIVVASPSAKN